MPVLSPRVQSLGACGPPASPWPLVPPTGPMAEVEDSGARRASLRAAPTPAEPDGPLHPIGLPSLITYSVVSLGPHVSLVWGFQGVFGGQGVGKNVFLEGPAQPERGRRVPRQTWGCCSGGSRSFRRGRAAAERGAAEPWTQSAGVYKFKACSPPHSERKARCAAACLAATAPTSPGEQVLQTTSSPITRARSPRPRHTQEVNLVFFFFSGLV